MHAVEQTKINTLNTLKINCIANLSRPQAFNNILSQVHYLIKPVNSLVIFGEY